MNQEKQKRQVQLDNGQLLEIYDASRKVGADTWLVKCIFRTEVKVERDLFTEEELARFSFEEIQDVLGEKAVFEKIQERNFISEKSKDELFESLTSDYVARAGKYIADPTFPKKLVIRKFLESRPKFRRQT